MSQTRFITELKSELTHLDFSFLRLLYTPIVGPRAIALFGLIYDFDRLQKEQITYYNFSQIVQILNCSEPEAIIERKKLEAVGLLRTFVKSDQKHYIFTLNRPLSPTEFSKNALLYQQVVNKISQETFDQIVFLSTKDKHEKSDFSDVTTKYQDLFSIHQENKLKNTQEIKKPSFVNIDQAIDGLSPEQFVHYLNKKHLSPSQLGMIQKGQRLHFNNKSINEIVHYSFLVNKRKIVAEHINSIMVDFNRKNLKNVQAIKEELIKAYNAKNKTKSPKLALVENDLDKTISQDKSCDDIFEAMGGL